MMLEYDYKIANLRQLNKKLKNEMWEEWGTAYDEEKAKEEMDSGHAQNQWDVIDRI